ncbi:34529_t:CDS:2, partial [Gigaspora margarita]
MSSRTSKNRANEKLNTNTANKRGRKKKEVVTFLPLNDNDDPLDCIDNSKNKKLKKLHTASYEKNDATVTSLVDNQTIDDILNSFDDSIEPNHNDEDVGYNSEIEETESSQSHIRSRAIISDDFNSTLISAPLRPSVTRAMSIHSDDFISSYETVSRPPISASSKCPTQRATSIFNDDFIPSNGPASRSLMPASSGSLQALNSDSSFMLNTPNIPSAFREITIYQLCLWLCKNQTILQLANSMNISMQSSVVDGSLFTSQLLPIISQPAIQDDKMKAGRDFLEELKCLFLRVRNPHKNAIEELVRQIIKCDLNSADGIEWLRVGNRHFGDFRNKLLDGTENLIELFKATKEGTSTLPKKEE